MRKVGIEIFYWIERWADDQTSYFERAKACGFDGVEMSIIDPDTIDFHTMRAELDRLDLQVLCSTGLGPDTDITSPDAGVRRAGIDYLKKCLEGAQVLRSPILGGVTYAPWMHFPDTGDLRPYRDRSAKTLHQVAAMAGDLGITLCMEILNRFETYMFNTVEDGLRFLKKVDHPAVKLQLDTFHMNIEEDNLAAAIQQAGDAIGHFHCAANSRKLPGKGHIDWQAINEALDAVAYQGWLVIETFPQPAVEVGKTVYTWRPLAGNLDEDAQQSLAFLRRLSG